MPARKESMWPMASRMSRRFAMTKLLSMAHQSSIMALFNPKAKPMCASLIQRCHIIILSFEERAKMPVTTTEKIWHNGKLIPWEQATIHVMSHVVNYGTAVFEGVRCYELPTGPAIFRAHEH